MLFELIWLTHSPGPLAQGRGAMKGRRALRGVFFGGTPLAAPGNVPWESVMESRVKFLGHSLHQQLVVFPLGLLATAVAFDLVNIFTDRPTMALVAYWLIVAGLIGGLLAAPFGFLDWLKIPAGTRAKSVGLMHGAINVVVLVSFAVSWYLRIDNEITPGVLARVFSFGGAGLAMVAAWLGGELVGRLGVGVSDDAHLDAPSSMSNRPARETVNAPPWG